MMVVDELLGCKTGEFILTANGYGMVLGHGKDNPLLMGTL
jgi:hypothetical protein